MEWRMPGTVLLASPAVPCTPLQAPSPGWPERRKVPAVSFSHHEGGDRYLFLKLMCELVLHRSETLPRETRGRPGALPRLREGASVACRRGATSAGHGASEPQ